MNKRIKVLSVLITVLMLFMAFSMSVYATPGVGENIGSDVVAPDPEPTPTPDPEPTPTPDPEPSVDTGTTTDPTTGGSGSVETPTTGDSGNVETPTTGGYVEDNNDDEFYFYDEDEMVNSIENSAGSVKDSTDLYDTSDINKSALKETKWDNITLDTSNKNSDAMDFSAIKENTESDDDGKWIIYAGFTLIGLAIIGIMYFIIATSTYKKKLKKLTERQARHNTNRARNDYGDYSDYPTQSDYNRHYSGKKRYASDGMGYAERKRMNKADTADIVLPAKYRAKH